MLTFFKLLFKFLELWKGIAAGTVAAEKILDSIDEVKDKIESTFGEMDD